MHEEARLLYVAVAAILKRERLSKGLVQSDVAARLCPPVARSHMSEWEKGGKGISLLQFVQVCRCIEIEPEKVLTEAFSGATLESYRPYSPKFKVLPRRRAKRRE